MFGRVRPAASSPESLERPPSKILKDHSLSVYENTIMKLKLGSKLQLQSGSDHSKADDEADDAVEDSFQSQLPPSKSNVSLLSLFSKYHRRSQELVSPSCDRMDDDLSSDLNDRAFRACK